MELILIIYLIVSLALIGIILIQQGKGAEMGASFGSGASNTVFGAAGSGNVLTKTTTFLAILFFAIALTISYQNADTEEVKDAVLDAPVAEEAASPEEQIAPEDQLAPVAADPVADEVPAEEKTEKQQEKDPPAQQ
ncbi:MAG: preprotein translocase subunit SecG [Gammaproteobacteria bacterium]|nr:preprotein translocase subunit SecG [Gammaproteobacteria bacterium]MDH5629250.1 preprotein translocase subunit SecG [Gammaproteobacteria bacterium]